MRAFSHVIACLAACSLVAAREYDYPADIEIDVLFPRDETYNNLTSFPVVLAIQDAKSAYRFDWEIQWKLFNAAPDASEYDYESGYSSHSALGINTFQWYFDDVAIVPLQGYNFTRLEPGPYRLEWEYLTSPCTHQPPNTIVYNIRRVVASGNQTFNIVNDGSGLDFDIPIDECPLYGAVWSTYESTGNYCPFRRENEDFERDPCDAQLENRQQVECIRQYLFEGTRDAPLNETEACRSSFERANPDWLRPLWEDDEQDGDDNDDADDDRDDDGEDNAGDDDLSNSGSTQDRDDDGDVAASIRPGLIGVVVAGVAAILVL
ncbi:hypothetical protein BJY04DRAFT_231623 [Aspergillus karnatakaensis]|uniref:uncharacterized protein n=1 Tax=Aspergillus karnatakaensis TaxID=1810916 RepID=UPI003CCE2C17